jgi:hypothetical protein
MSIKKCVINCIRDSTNELLEEDLMRIVEISKNIKLMWNKYFIEFQYSKNESPESPMKGFYPYSGSWEILGVTVEIKVYSNLEFIKLYETSTQLIAIDVDTSNIGTCNELFQKSDVIWLTNYSKLISFLESNNYVRTKYTENWLSVDGRKFKIEKRAIEHVPLLSSYIENYYEVDSLGTRLFEELTSFLEMLCECIQKSLK